MAKSKKSKILAMALCASVMTGIYASPVMAAELYENTSDWVTTNSGGATKITELEGLEEITLGDSVKIIAGDGGIIRVGDAGGVNTRVHDDGFYINETGNDRKTSLTAGTLTLAGKELTSAQLANINNIIGVNGVIKAADGSTVGGVKMKAGRVSGKGFFVKGSDNALDTTGLKLGNEYLNETKLGAINDVITNDGAVESKDDVTSKAADGKTYSLNTVGKNTSGITIDSEGKVTTIEGAFSVDEKGYIYNANRSFQVTKDGAARFGNKYDDHIRMEDGVLSVKTDQNTTVARVSKDGFYVYKDNDTVAASLTKNGLTADSINVGGGNFTVAHNGSVKAADERFIIDADGKVTATEFTAGEYNLTEIGKKTAGITQYKNNTTYFKGAVNVDRLEAGDTVVDDRGVFVKTDDQSIVAQITEDGLKLGNESLTATKLGTINDVITDNGEVVSQGDVTSTYNKEDGSKGHYYLNKVGADLDALETNVGNISGKVAGIKRNDLNLPYGEGKTEIEGVVGVNGKDGRFYVLGEDGRTQAAVITNDGTARFGDYNNANVRMENGVLSINSEGTNAVASLSKDGLMLSDVESGKQTLNATDIADIKGIDRRGNDTDGHTTTIEVATSFTKDGMVTSNITTGSFTAGVTADSSYGINATGEMLFRSGDNYIGMDRNRIGFTSGTESVTINGEGTTFTSGDSTTRTITSTVIKGGTIKTGTLEVENIKLGDSMTDKDGNTITIGAAGIIDIKEAGNTVFYADTENFKAHYANYDLTLNGTNGFALSQGTSKFTLKDNAFAFAGPVHLGDGTLVEFSHNETNISLSSLVNRVENLEQKTTGISFDESTGNTTIKDMNKGTDGKWTAGGSSVTVGDNGTTFENGEGNGATNINGGAIYANSSSIGNHVSGGSGSGGSGSGSSGTYTDGIQHSGHFEDGANIYEFTNDAYGFTGTVTDGKNTTTIKNGAMGSNTTVKGEGNTSASSGVGIGNDGAFISDSVTNGDISHTVDGGSITDTVTNDDMTVTEVKDKNGSATTVKDDNGSSTVSQDTKGQTVSTGTGTSVNTGNDFGVTDNETGKSIYMSDIGHVEDIDSEIQNSDGSKTTVVDAVNNEAEIRRNEIERVDGRINNLENRVGKLEDRVDKVGAMAAAIANLRTMGYDPAAPTEVAVGIGQYRDETGAALGLFHYPNRDFMLSLSVSTSGDEVMGGIGATWKFGRKSPEKVAEIKKAQAEADARRAEEAKLAKAEEMKQAAKEAKIKAQQERHAKLAAQAEAAK